MRRMIAMACVLAMISGGVWAQQSGAQAPARQKTHALKLKKKKASAKRTAPAEAVVPAEPVPAQIMPPVPATLMNSAPVKPNVTMADGLLTIDAPNSTLGDVLSGVRKATGAVVEGASPGERVAVRLGPGNPRQVIAALLQGTPYDYVILGSRERQDVVTRIVLTQSSETSPSQNAPGAGRQPPIASQPPPEDNFTDSTSSADDAAAAPPAAEVEADPGPQPPRQPPQDPNQPKAPEQLLQELQQSEQPRQ
jgi:hypothetical protein